MRVACISDTHGREYTLPANADVVVHAGDLSAGGDLQETLLALGELRGHARMGTPIIVVPGNHDRALQEELPEIQETLQEYAHWGPVHILIDQVVVIGGRTFYGSPWTPTYNNWSFMADEGRLEELFNLMPIDLDIDMLITHGPPRGVLDPGFNADHVGSEALLAAISARRYNIDHHVFGHLHGAGGQSCYGRSILHGNIQFHNVAACDMAYNIARGAKIIEL